MDESFWTHLLRAICARENLEFDTLQPISGGQVNQVYQVNQQHILRIGTRANASERMGAETSLLRRLAGLLPVARIDAFGEIEGHPYQIQERVPGQKLYVQWEQLSAGEQEQIVLELARCRQVLSGLSFPDFGPVSEPAGRRPDWEDYFSHRFQAILAEIETLGIRVTPGFLQMSRDYFETHRAVLKDGPAVLVHGDLNLGNVLVHQGHISALVDFEFAVQAPPDYELHILEAFCLYPNDYAEEDPAIQRAYTSADFGGVFKLLQKLDPGLFKIPHLRERVNLYHLVGTWQSYLEWRKQQRGQIPYSQLAAQGFYQARIANFTSNHNASMF
jgi:aminoglycoside phosphotransferase (APT) family kinase protein